MKNTIKHIRAALYDIRMIVEEERNNIQAAIDMGYRGEVGENPELLATYNVVIKGLRFLSD